MTVTPLTVRAARLAIEDGAPVFVVGKDGSITPGALDTSVFHLHRMRGDADSGFVQNEEGEIYYVGTAGALRESRIAALTGHLLNPDPNADISSRPVVRVPDVA